MTRQAWEGAPFIHLSLCLLIGFVAGCSGAPQTKSSLSGYPIGYEERGLASWYGPGFHGHRTASGERFDKTRLTAAHRTLPMGALVSVTSKSTRRHVTVRINDRGPFAEGRIIDLSEAAARALGIADAGTDEVVLRVVGHQGGSGAAEVLRVQVGSFADAGLARTLAGKLRDHYTDVRITETEFPAGRRYRVQVGRFSSEDQANVAAKELNARFRVESVVVRDGV